MQITYQTCRILCLVVAIMATMIGCAGKSGYATVATIDYSESKKLSKAEKTAKFHRVKRGETLYSIAWNYGKSFKSVAALNRIKPPYTIYPGQKILLQSPKKIPAKKKRKANKNNKIEKEKVASKKAPVIRRSTDARNVGKVLWRWPASGKLVGRFSSNGRFNKGIDIAGKLGEPVYAAAKGKVVFAGSGLRGYGKLVIIHHNDKYLSAYAHNKKLLVKENQIIKAGQKIAEIGSTGTNKPKLHFEIRKDGKPVDPLRYLPRR